MTFASVGRLSVLDPLKLKLLSWSQSLDIQFIVVKARRSLWSYCANPLTGNSETA